MTIDWTTKLASYTAATCTQSTDARCTSAALSSYFGNYAAVMAAYCNADYLVIHTTNAPGWTPYLDDAKTPPGGTDTVSGTCRTRTASITNAAAVYKIPLTVTALTGSTASATVNNIAAFTGSGDSYTSPDVGYLINTSDTSIYYGLNARGPVGVTVAGQEIYPVYNNRAQYTPQDCEVDACNEHVGQGGGQPHLHGDPFHSTDGVCLYGPANYTSTTVHPPQWGFSLDGYNIYGRHINANNEGYSVALDDCGGHTHGTYGYHYHSQVITAYTTSAAQKGIAAGQAYAVHIPGVFKCWKGDLTSVPGGSSEFWSSSYGSTYLKPCNGMTNYYVKSGYTLKGIATTAPSRAPTRAPTAKTTTKGAADDTAVAGAAPVPPAPTTTSDAAAVSALGLAALSGLVLSMAQHAL